MSERNDLPRSVSSPSNPAVPAARSVTEALANSIQAVPGVASHEEEARGRIAKLEREAKAMGADPTAALLFHEIGLIWEDALKNPRNAAVAYQNAFKLAPKFVANIRAARRLFAEVGNWLMVVQLLDAELAAIDQPRQKAPLLLEKATLLEERLSREEDAAKVYQECVALEPDDLPTLIQLEGVFAAKADHASLVRIQRLLATHLRDEGLRAHYLTQAGFVLENRLGKPEEAAACFRDAFAMDRRDPLLLAAVMRVAEREDQVEELLTALAAEAETLGPQAAPTYLRISKVYDRLGRKDDALAALLAARRVNPKEPLVLSELAQIYESQSRHEELADVLLAWLECVSDESELVAINLRLASLYEENLKRDPEAIQRYQAILQHIPGHASALAGLGKLYYRTQNWEGLVASYDQEIAAANDPKQQAARMFRAAEILEERLGRQEDAIQRYNKCLQLQPGYLPAQKALTRLYEKQGRYAELVAMYEQDLLQTSDRDQIMSTLNKIALLYEERLSDMDHAVDALRRILDLVPDHLSTLRNLARLLERANRWRDLIQLQETEASLVGDTKQVLSLHHRNAEILEESLKDREGAIAAYERVLALSPSYLPALKALGRLYAQDQRWQDLIRMYRAEAEISPSTDQAASLIFKVGELYEQKLQNENDAIASYQEVLTLAPSYFPALRALARIYRAQSAWESLVDVLRSEAANRTDPVERANALFQAAAIWEDQLNRIDMATEGYQDVLRLTPGHAAAIRALERLYISRNEVKELIAVLDRETQTGQTTAAKVSAYLKLAHIYLDRLNEAGRAAQCAEAALAIEPTNLSALKALERVRASDRARRAEVRLRLAETVTDPRLRTALKLSAGADASPAGDGVRADLQAAVAENPTDPRLFLAYERALRHSGDHAELVAALKSRLERTTDPLDRTEILLRIGDLAESRLNDSRAAVEAYRGALELNPQLLPALEGLRRACERLEDWAGARNAYEEEAKAARDARSAIEALVAAGRIAHQKLNDPDGAIADFRKALERDPLDPEASTGIEEILAQRGGAADLAALQERRAEAKLAQKDLPAAASEFFQAARTYLHKLQDRPKALAAVDRALAAQPTHPDALELKGVLAFEAQQYPEAASAFALRIQQGGEPNLLAALHLKLGVIYQDHLSDTSRAAAHLQTALSDNPGNPEALERLANIHTAARNWTGAADCLKQLLTVEAEPTAQARHHIALARIYDEGLGDVHQATTLYKRALELAPSDRQVLDRLVQIYEKMGNLPELAQLLEQQAQRSNDPTRTVSLRLKIADIHAKSADQPQRAIAAFRQVLEIDPTCVPAHAALADLYMRDAAAAPMAIEQHRHLIRLDPTRLESLHALFRLWEGLRQHDKAFCAASILSFFKSTNEVETAFYVEAKNRLPQDFRDPLEPAEVETLMHPDCRGNALVEVLRAIGDQLSKIYPPQFDALGVDRKADRLKPDHAVFKAIRSVAHVFGVEEFEVYRSRRGLMQLETTEPLAVCVSEDVVRKFNAREQRFLIGRAAFGLFNRTAILAKLSPGEVADLIGNSIRIFTPDFAGLGRKNDETSKQLRKAYSRKALKALETAALSAGGTQANDLSKALDGLSCSADRAGLLLAGDVSAGLAVLIREESNLSTVRVEGAEPILQAVRQRPDLREVLGFALSDDFFRLRQKTGVALP